MKLEGSLDAFSLPDIFQLLSFTRKTGGLHLASAGCDGVVYFGAGMISGASADSSRLPLARRLAGLDTVTDEALSAAVTTAISTNNVGVVRALRDAAAIDAEVARSAAADQAVEAVLALTRWASGDFAFVVDEANPDDVGVAIAVPDLLEQVEERRSTWDEVAKVIPSPKTVLAMAAPSTDDLRMSRDEWALLSLLDGRRTVSDVVDLAGAGQFGVVSRLAGLVRRGLLRVAESESDRVAMVVRRLELLEPLEHFAPAPNPVAECPSGPVDAPAEVERVAAAEAEAVEPAVKPAVEPAAKPAIYQAPAVLEAVLLGGAHVPGDVVPPRPEPFLPQRCAEYDDHARLAEVRALPALVGAVAAVPAAVSGVEAQLIERDPSVNRSLMLRLIAGVRGL